jgi:hypothetical protein
VESLAERENCPLNIIGQVGGQRLRLKLDQGTGQKAEEVIDMPVSELERVWRSSLSKKLEAEVMAAGRE